MTKDQSYGGLILVVSVLVVALYLSAFIFRPDWTLYLIGIPVVIAVLGILGITAWIGYTMYSTPPPAPLESELTNPTTTSTPSMAPKPEEKK